MKIYSLCTPPFSVFRDEWFLPTIPNDLEPQIEMIDSKDAYSFASESFNKLMLAKVELILERGIAENPGELFIYSDIDVQFFRPFTQTAIDLSQNFDLLVQRDSPNGHICAGFLIIRGNDRCRSLFQAVRQSLANDPGSQGDQCVLNTLLLLGEEPESDLPWHASVERLYQKNQRCLAALTAIVNPYQVQWNYLPEQFFSAGTIDGVRWNPGMDLSVPEQPILHHANWTIGMEAKLEQLDQVSKTVKAMSHI